MISQSSWVLKTKQLNNQPTTTSFRDKNTRGDTVVYEDYKNRDTAIKGTNSQH